MFNEANTVEAYVRDLLAGPIKATPQNTIQESLANYGPSPKDMGWRYAASSEVPRQTQEVLVEPWVRNALIRLNPEIAAQPDRSDEVLYKLRAIVLSVRSDGLIRANEEFTAWLRGERSMPFGENNEHVQVRLIDFDKLDQNQYVVTQQFTYRAGSAERRADLVLLVNGFPLVLIEAKTPSRAAVTWVDGAVQVHDDYEKFVPELFVCNVFSVATDGKEYHYGSLGLPVKDWGPWHLESPSSPTPLAGDGSQLKTVKLAVESMLRPHVVLDILASFTLFATDKKKCRSKVICRYQQYEAANKIVERVLAGTPKKGLIWHFQGSGKSLLMVFAAQKLRLHPALRNPTVIIVVDRIDLDTQITGAFTGADIPNLEKAETRDRLQQLLAQDVRKIIITTIFKFGEADGVLNERHNIIALVDEAHRTQEGDLGRKMRAALPNAFLFGLTGTPINRIDRNTFYAFGADEDDRGYLSRYGFEASIRDGATLKLHFEPRLLELHIDKAAIDAAFKEMTGGLSDLDRDSLGKTAAKMAVLVKTLERVRRVCEDIVQHFQSKVEPNGFKGQIVTIDRESCLLYKAELDRLLPPEASAVVMTVNANEPARKAFAHTRDEEERLLDRFRDAKDPLKLLIVTSKLLTGFDAPILQAMYLDKPLRDHTLLQAICRVNRTYSDQKTHGLIVDYLGIFDDVAKALEFDDKSMAAVVSNIQELKDRLPQAMQKCLAFFAGVDRTVEGYEGLIAAQQCLPNNTVRDNFAADYSVLGKLWEAISPDTLLGQYEKDYKWLSQVYQSVQPSSGQGRLIWHSLGAKTIELIHQNVHVDTVRDDLDTLILDADLLEAVLSNPDPKKAKEIEIKVARRLRKHLGNPKFKALSERLDALRDRFESGVLNSVEFLKQLLEIAKEVLQAEKETPPEEDVDRGMAALTELFNEVKTENTPIVVERVVADIDEIVRLVRFPGWQDTLSGEREIKKALRKSLFKYKLHADEELFEKAYSYIRQYY
mgnify:FL=1